MPKGVPVTVSAILPIDERVTQNGFNQRISDINRRLETLVKSQGAQFINIRDDITNDKGNLKTEYHLGDGLHLTTAAYDVWIKRLKELF